MKNKFGLFLAICFLLFLGMGIFIKVYTDMLWFQELGYTQIYWTKLFTEIGIYSGSFILFFLIVWGNVWYALKSGNKLNILQDNILDLHQDTFIKKPTTRLFLIGTAFFSFVLGTGNIMRWDQLLGFIHPSLFNQTDPVFNKDIAFYVFTVPVLNSISDWLLSVLIVSMIGTLIAYGMHQVMSLTKGKFSLNPGIIGHLSVLLGLLFFVIGFRYWLDGFDLLFTQHHNGYGAYYADVHANLFFCRLMMGYCMLSGLLMIFNFQKRRMTLPLFIFGGWVVLSILFGGIYPALLQRFFVTPNEISKEAPYIQQNIDFTNRAYKLDKIKEYPFPAAASLTREVITRNAPTMRNIRLWDHRPLLETYKQIQVIRQYYDFHDIDIDRYTLGNEYVQVMLSPREITIPPTARTWTNERMVYTHGYGLAMTRVNAVEREGLPKLLVKDIPPNAPKDLEITRPEIYFGESQQDYILVKTQEKEFDYPKGNENVYTTYAGKAGISIGSILRRLAFAYHFGSTDLFFTSRLTPDTRIIYRRQITERVNTLFPFLKLDKDPYMVIDQGRLVWVMDAYTRTSRYPYSLPVFDSFNYIRNSVKIVVDAYDGTVQGYISDSDDPIIQTWMKIFPNIFKPLSAMPESLHKHLRYPEQLFDAQTRVYAIYHMKEAQVFYNQEDKWNIPIENYEGQEQSIDPYYVIMRLPNETNEEFILMRPFTPQGKNNMIAWMAAKCDPNDYGNLMVYKFSKDRLIYGPQQIEARIDQDPAISPQLSLWNQQGSRVSRGNLLVIPIEDSILYVEPIYLKSEQSQIPELKRIVVAYDERIAMESTLEDALAAIFGGKASSSTDTNMEAPSRDTTKSIQKPSSGPTIRDLSRQASQAYQKAQDKLKAGDWAGYGEEMKKLKEAIQQLERISGK